MCQYSAAELASRGDQDPQVTSSQSLKEVPEALRIITQTDAASCVVSQKVRWASASTDGVARVASGSSKAVFLATLTQVTAGVARKCRYKQ